MWYNFGGELQENGYEIYERYETHGNIGYE